MMTGNALRRSFKEWAAVATQHACTKTESHKENDTIYFFKVSKLERFDTFTFINLKEPIM